MDIVVSYQSAPARYSVIKEAEGIYLAELQNYTGDPGRLPPLRVVLVKSFRAWTGSCDHPELLNSLGRAIENATAGKRPPAKDRLT